MNKKIKINIASLFIFILLTLTSACSKKESQPVDEADTLFMEDNQLEETLTTSTGMCNNIFYPLALDNQWIYQIQVEGAGGNPELSDLGLTVSEVNDSSAVLAALDYGTGIVTKSIVDCNQGAILNFPMTELNLVFGEAAGDIQLEYSSGIFMPSESDFIADDWINSWKTEYSANGKVSGTYDNNSATVNLSESPVSMEWELSEKDLSLQIPAGIFNDVVLIKRQLTFDITSLKTTFGGQVLDISTTLIIKTNMWYAPHVGLLKQEIDSAAIKLYGINFPIESIGIIELKSSNLIK